MTGVHGDDPLEVVSYHLSCREAIAAYCSLPGIVPTSMLGVVKTKNCSYNNIDNDVLSTFHHAMTVPEGSEGGWIPDDQLPACTDNSQISHRQFADQLWDNLVRESTNWGPPGKPIAIHRRGLVIRSH